MIGRAEYVHEKTGLATTFACSSCCPDSFYLSWTNPNPTIIPKTQNDFIHGIQQNKNCYGTPLSPFQTDSELEPVDMGVEIVVIVNQDLNEVKGMTVGVITVVVKIVVTVWYYAGHSQGCQSNTYQHGMENETIVWDFAVSAQDSSVPPSGTTGDPTTTVTVELLPVRQGFESSVSLEAIRIGTTGGHGTSGSCHQTTPSAAVAGSLASTGGSIGYSTNGLFETQFTAGTASGISQVVATIAGRTKIEYVETRVQGLTNLADGNNYFLRRVDACHGNGDYHYGTQGLHQAIVNAADHFWNNWGSSQSPQMGMVPNDQSLVWGGLFDISGNWSTQPFGHTTHREGNIVDITFRVWTGGGDTPKVDPNFCALSSQSECQEAWDELEVAVMQAFDNNCQIHSPGTENAHWHCTN
jgi:hypothetical protein